MSLTTDFTQCPHECPHWSLKRSCKSPPFSMLAKDPNIEIWWKHDMLENIILLMLTVSRISWTLLIVLFPYGCLTDEMPWKFEILVNCCESRPSTMIDALKFCGSFVCDHGNPDAHGIAAHMWHTATQVSISPCSKAWEFATKPLLSASI